MIKKISLLLSFLLLLAAVAYRQARSYRAEDAAKEQVHVLVARYDLPARTVLNSDLIDLKQVARRDLLAGAREVRSVSDIKVFDGRVTAAPVAKGAQIVPASLAAERQASSGSYNDRGAAYARDGKYGQAAEYLKKAVALNPADALAYYNLGNVYGKQNDYAAAIESYSKALAIDPKLAQAYFTRGSALYLKGDSGRALEDYNKALSLDPRLAKAYYARAVVCRELGENGKAAADEASYRRLVSPR